jgi:hypothetical protein
LALFKKERTFQTTLLLSLSLSLSPPVSKSGVEDGLKKHLNAVLPFVVVGARNNLFHQET